MTSVYVERFESEQLLKVTPGELYNQVYAEEGGDAPDSIEYLATVQRWLQRVVSGRVSTRGVGAWVVGT